MRPVGEEIMNLKDDELNAILKRSEKNLEIVTILAVGLTFVLPWVANFYLFAVLPIIFNLFLLWFIVFIYYDIRDDYLREVRRRRENEMEREYLEKKRKLTNEERQKENDTEEGEKTY